MKKILVIGGGNLQVPIIKKINEMGFFAYCVDKQTDAPGYKYAKDFKVIDVLDKEKCLEYAIEIGIDAVLTYASTITLPTVAFIAKKLNLTALNEETAEIAKNKYLIKKVLSEKNVNDYGEFFELKNINDINKILQKINYPVVVKPSDGSASKGVSIVTNENELQKAIEYAFEESKIKSVYIEKFIKGQEYGVECFVENGNIHIITIIKQDAKLGHIIPCGLSLKKQNQIKNLIKKSVKALNINFGSINFDLIFDDTKNQPFIIDLGMRVGQNAIGSHIVPILFGIDIEKNTILSALNLPVNLSRKHNRKVLISKSIILKKGVIKEIKSFDEIYKVKNVIIILRIKQGDIINEVKNKSNIRGWVIIYGNNKKHVYEKAKNIYEKIVQRIIIDEVI